MKFFGHRIVRFDYFASGFGVRRKTIDSFTTGRFAEVYGQVAAQHRRYFRRWPDFRWRAHTAVWAAQTGLARDGDFVELGVHTGFLSHMICEMLDIDRTGRRFFLFDTFAGIPLDEVNEDERARARAHNTVYFDVYETTQGLFRPYSAVELVRGTLPGSLDGGDLGRIAYLSIDLNYSTVEIDCIRRLWPLLSPGAVVVLDDYAWHGHEDQKRAWDAWAREEGRSVYTVPTGQGLLVK